MFDSITNKLALICFIKTNLFLYLIHKFIIGVVYVKPPSNIKILVIQLDTELLIIRLMSIYQHNRGSHFQYLFDKNVEQAGANK